MLQRILPHIQTNGAWYISTQEYKQGSNVFYWNGTTKTFCLPSGMDDYPRSGIEDSVQLQGHVDLQSWMIVLTRTISKVESLLNVKDTRWKALSILYTEILLEMFWDDHNKVFDDFYIKNGGNKVFVGHRGYLQLFPLILDVLDNLSQKQQILENILKVKHSKIRTSPTNDYLDYSLQFMMDSRYPMLSNYGVRSLSIQDEYYRKSQNYWTSPVWMNINYLILRKVKVFKEQGNPYALAIYLKTKESLTSNVLDKYKTTGFIWEVYDDQDGTGLYNHPFTGWSSLIVPIIYELY